MNHRTRRSTAARSRAHARSSERPSHRRRVKRSLAIGTALALAAGTVLTGVGLLVADTAEARYATGGEGLHLGAIDWIEWGENGDVIENGTTVSSTRSIAGHELTTTCTVTNIDGNLKAYRSGTWTGDALDHLYNIGGTGTDNQLVQALSNADFGGLVAFDFSCEATLDGAAIPLQGLVVADAEASNHRDDPTATEYAAARPAQGATWRIIDRYRTPGCEEITTAELSADGTMTFRPAGDECANRVPGGHGPMAVGFMEGATGAHVELKGGGHSAIGLGVVLEADFGDAPESYGAAGAIFEPTWIDGEVPAGRTDVSSPTFELARQSVPHTRLGELVDSDPEPLFSADALRDDHTDLADEDAIEPLGTVSVTPGQRYTLPEVSCTGPGFVAGWLDWNGNGAFDDDERSAAVECTSGSVALSWTVPDDAVAGETFLRLRIAQHESEVASPVGMTTTGEVEDHALTLDLPEIEIGKTSDATADSRPGDVVTYTVTATNTSGADYTSDFPAVVFDDLSGALDDASYNDDASATRPGALDAQLPLLSWVGPLPAGESVDIVYGMTLGAGGDGEVRNIAWVPADSETPTPPACVQSDDGRDATTGEPCAVHEYLLPRLTIEKDADREDLPALGERIEYTVVVSNVGPGDYTVNAPASFVDDLSDVLDSATYLDDASASVGEITYDAPNLAWSGPLEAGETATVRYSFSYTGEGDKTLRNLACIPLSETAPDAESCATVVTPGSGLSAWKQVTANEDPVVAGTVLTYTLFFANDGDAAATVDHVDDLTHVIDDADITSEPTASAGLTVDRDGSRIAIAGSVPQGETFTVEYEVTVKEDGERGDDRAVNFLLAAGSDVPPSPPVCHPADPDRPDCTVTPVSWIDVVKSSDPAPGTAVRAGEDVVYTLTFTNDGAATGAVDHIDDLAAVLDDADLTAGPVASDPALTATTGADGIVRVTGELGPGQAVEVTYTVTVKPDGERGDNRLRNVVTAAGDPPPEECEPGRCTEHPIGELETWKSVDPASGSTLRAGETALYTLHFFNAGTAVVAVDMEDVLDRVLDDAEVTGIPVASGDSLEVGEIDQGRFRITGELAPAESATVRYEVTVRPDGERGDDRLENFLLQHGHQPPEGACAPTDPERPDCTVTHVSDILVEKTSDPVSGTFVAPDEDVVYTVTFTNRSVNPDAAGVVIDVTDHLGDVFDDATLTDGPRVSDDSLAATLDGDRLRISGAVPSGAVIEVTYTVTVNEYDSQGDRMLGNVVAHTGDEPVCAPGSALCTRHPVTEPPVIPVAPDEPEETLLAVTGAAIPAAVLFTAVLLVGAGATMLMIRRRRGANAEKHDEEVRIDGLM